MKKLFALLLTVLVIFSLVSCGAQMDNAMGEGLKGETSSTSSPEANDLAERKIIRRVSIDMETKHYDETLNTLHGAMAAVGAYASNINEYSRSGSRHANYVIRVPSANLEAFLTSVETMGNVLSRTESAEDVTLAYVDVESRIRALKAEETALTEMLEKATNLNSLLDIRSRLTEVRYQLDSYESQLRKYDDLIDYSTVNLSVAEVERLANVRGGVWGQIGDDFMDNVYAIADGAVALFIWLVGNIPVFVQLGGIGTGLFFLIRHVQRKRYAKAVAETEARKAAKQQPEEK